LHIEEIDYKQKFIKKGKKRKKFYFLIKFPYFLVLINLNSLLFEFAFFYREG